VTDDLVSRIKNVRFTPVRLHEGYDMGEVDYLLDRLLAAVEGTDPGNAVIEILDHVALSEVRLREGYDIAEVDAFLAEIRAAVAAPAEAAPAAAPDPGFLDVQAPPPVTEHPQVIVEQRGFFARLFGKR
jgi:DivIVA domain-containing protein